MTMKSATGPTNLRYNIQDMEDNELQQVKDNLIIYNKDKHNRKS